ncbi:hypothetical protein NN561_020308 [Cricetulus griseus]
MHRWTDQRTEPRTMARAPPRQDKSAEPQGCGPRGGGYLRELPGMRAAEERGAGAEADGSSAAEDVLRDRPVQGQHRQLVAYFH